MSQTDKADYYQALREAGVTFEKHYREYSTEELASAYTRLKRGLGDAPLPAGSTFLPPPPRAKGTESPSPVSEPQPVAASVPMRAADPDEMAGQRLNTQPVDEPIRTDEQGRIWFQEEVQKKGYAAPRGRRILRYSETGTETQKVQNGEYVEEFEVAGQGPARTAEIKITLPSYQTGIYIDPRYKMFRIHTYNGVQGFDLEDVAKYFGGTDMVPEDIKRIYVENVLCYDIRTVVRWIQKEYRQLQLTGKVD
jgi:hypothetical protein